MTLSASKNSAQHYASQRVLRSVSTGESGSPDYWKRRQAALGIKTHGERLEPDEIAFCERLQKQYLDRRLCNVLEWIARDQCNAAGDLLPTNDFVWLSHDGHEWELKTPAVPNFSSIKNRIRDDFRKGKVRFLVDLGDNQLEAELRRSLVRYANKRGVTVAIMSIGGAALDFL